ncbi:Uncharacterised protein [Bacteroides xylanisolvens]|nr:Uncharacterised protein [Bacteroides xylanisolvens]
MKAAEEAAVVAIAENVDRKTLKGVIPDVNSKAYKIS